MSPSQSCNEFENFFSNSDITLGALQLKIHYQQSLLETSMQNVKGGGLMNGDKWWNHDRTIKEDIRLDNLTS